MKKFNLLLLLAVLTGVSAMAQNLPDMAAPTNGVPGKCYAKCVIPDQYETVEERILIRPASSRTVVSPAEFETMTERVMLKAASTRIVPKPAVYETMTERVLKREVKDGLTAVPAEYETVTERVLIKDASTRIVPKPAVYETVTERVKIKDASTRIVAVPAEYETQTERVLIKAASTQIRTIPAVYETKTERVMTKAASTRIVAVPAEYRTETERVMIKAASSRIEKVPASYTTETETIETKPASTKWVKRKGDANCLSADPNDCLVWCLVEEPAQYRTVTKSVRQGCPEGYVSNGDDCTREVEIPAEYAERTYRVLDKPATTEVIEIPAEYGERTWQVVATPATSEVVEIPAEYGERTWRKLVKPATTEVIEIPAEYAERTWRKLVTPATTEVIEIPAEYAERTYRKLKSAATTRTVPCSKSLILDNINFETASAVLKQSSYAEISQLEAMLKEKPNVTAKLVGHTDNVGSESSNQVLSENRAKAVYDVLVSNGIAASRLSYEGKGESSPIASNGTAAGRLRNRRTEFITYGDGGASDCNEYETRTWQKLVTPATTEVIEIPAEYGERTYQKLSKPASISTIEIPAEYTSVSKRRLVKKGGFTEYREVVCGSAVTSDLVRRVQAALRDKGYDPGPADNVMGGRTKAALKQFQTDKGLPIGNLDFETLKALGIRM